MFIYSVKSSTIKFFSVIAISLIMLGVILSLGQSQTVYASVDGIEINYGGIDNNEDRINFINQFGIKVNEALTEEKSFALPRQLDRVMTEYNQIQKIQGLDISKYTVRKVTRYTYEATNYDYDGMVYVNLIVYRNRIIACDISSTDGNGFVQPLSSIDESKLKGTD